MTDRTITTEQLETLVETGIWSRQQEHEHVETTSRATEGELGRIDIDCSWGIAWLDSTCDGLTITYHETYNYDLYEPDSLAASTDAQDMVWTLHGATLIDEDGKPMSAEHVGDYVTDSFRDIDYDALLTIREINDMDDIDEDTITLKNDNAPGVRFQGNEVASVSSFCHSGPRNIRWTEITLYLSRGGQHIAHEVGRTIWDGEHDRHTVHVCANEAELIDALGHGWLAKDLYDECEIEHAVSVD